MNRFIHKNPALFNPYTIKTTKICILILACLNYLEAQNLIPDSSFENNKFIPIDFSAINASNSWNMPSWGTTDLFCKCERKKKIYSLVDVPQNLMGYQDPHSGTCYAGLFAFSHGNYREYLQTPLQKPLVKNKTYLFTMYLSLADYSRTRIDRLGVCFLTDKTEYKSVNVITNLNPVYVKIENEVGKDIKEWHRVTVTYKSNGGESYLLIGSFEISRITKTKFKAPKEIKSRINQNSERDAYYYIDDISLIEIPDIEPPDSIMKPELKTIHKITLNTSFVFENVLFQINEAILLPSSYSELDLLTEHLKKNPQVRIEIVGHTDNSGNEKVNEKLSVERAKAVSDYLITKGINKTRIIYNGYGSSRPVAPNNTEEGRQKNRRVEFIVRKT